MTTSRTRSPPQRSVRVVRWAGALWSREAHVPAADVIVPDDSDQWPRETQCTPPYRCPWRECTTTASPSDGRRLLEWPASMALANPLVRTALSPCCPTGWRWVAGSQFSLGKETRRHPPS